VAPKGLRFVESNTRRTHQGGHTHIDPAGNFLWQTAILPPAALNDHRVGACSPICNCWPFETIRAISAAYAQVSGKFQSKEISPVVGVSDEVIEGISLSISVGSPFNKRSLLKGEMRRFEKRLKDC